MATDGTKLQAKLAKGERKLLVLTGLSFGWGAGQALGLLSRPWQIIVSGGIGLAMLVWVVKELREVKQMEKEVNAVIEQTKRLYSEPYG